jgi:hypothetical protein
VVSRPARDPLARLLGARFGRLKNASLGLLFFKLARRRPGKVRAKLLDLVRESLPPGYDVERHFGPSYNPWDQRLCLVPDGDLFDAIRGGKVSVVTDEIERFTDGGILTRSGALLEADIIVTATGFHLSVLGDIAFTIDGEPLDAPAGTLVFVQPGIKRTAFAEEPGTTLVALGGVPGKAYATHGYDIWGPIQPLYQAGEYEQAAERLDTALADDPPFWGVHYNAACIYSLTGRLDDATAHLRRAHELAGEEADVREMAKGDSDLDAIRAEAAYQDLVGGR